MNQELFDWILLIARWVHITVAVTWIGTSIFFMWLDRSFVKNPDSKNEGHVGDLWMVHGGGFYHVEKLLMGPTKVPEHLHWFKWESYWTWFSGLFLVIAIFYTGGGTFLLDPEVSNITYWPAVGVGLFSLIGSWFYYDFLWERKLTRDKPIVGHILTLVWFVGMTYYLCHTFSGRAAYIHIGGMLGTWMTANVFMRIIPRQVKMVEASRKGEEVNQDWGKNAKNRSTHNTYFTLPVIFIMLSNHFPATYGHELN
ncbi:MAG: urate hydroxylase PuuD, partial [Halobacteriovoraceae bacterium]|nr:urate hydroxylase PuuD [Halobacteriovoraceae bacterium]